MTRCCTRSGSRRHAGLDESGKGDFFGPVVAATVIAGQPAIDGWLKRE